MADDLAPIRDALTERAGDLARYLVGESTAASKRRHGSFSVALTEGAAMKRAIHRLSITSNDTGQERSTKYERLGELLRKYGLDLINSEQFWAEMKRQGLGQADIDEWCDEYHRKTEAEQ